MKKNFISIISFIFLIFMLINPLKTKEAAVYGLNLWFFTIIPALLPFMIISSLIVETNSYSLISNTLGKIMPFLFCLPATCAYPFFIGMICGIPVGAKTIATMVSKNAISSDCGNVLLSFCNNLSPAFLLTYVLGNLWKLNGFSLFITFFMIIISQILTGIIIGHIFHPKPFKTLPKPAPADSFSTLIDVCILKSFSSLLKLCGYIIIFSIINTLFTFPYPLNTLFEATYGLGLSKSLLHACLIFSFSGLCQAFQVYNSISETALDFRFYILGKTINVFLVYILFSVIHC